MLKSELETGMIVRDRDGSFYVVLKNICNCPMYNTIGGSSVLLALSDGRFTRLDFYDIDLLRTDSINRELDIMEIYELEYFGDIIRHKDIKNMRKTLLWRRDEIKELTLKEIEDLLGYPVKIKEE